MASPVYWNSGDDEQMNAAMREASQTFKYLWRELSWEYRRIIPALDLAAVKVSFSDDDNDGEDVEHMWVNNIMFDGKTITGELLNVPNELKSIQQGDAVNVTVDGISDWMFVSSGKVYGAHTVNLMRSRMSKSERTQHDKAWGLDFGDPEVIELKHGQVTAKKKSIFNMFSKKTPEADVMPSSGEHPMCLNMVEGLAEELAKNLDAFVALDDNGWAYIHHEALAGNAPSVKALLDHGVDPKVKTSDGQTALDLAKILNWENVISLFE